MIVMKFGGTSVGKPERLRKVADLVLSTPGKKIVVLSALSGTTNALVSIGENLMAANQEKAEAEIASLEQHYHNYIGELFKGEASHAIGKEIVGRYFILIR
ncbi:MAG TPA: aspartate kinase, partial [Chryseosolibacter sp.]|nr:aspartate kinase [Chryseosolibacter sp.]